MIKKEIDILKPKLQELQKLRVYIAMIKMEIH